MKVIAGKYKNFKILEPSFENTRPTKSIVREAIFDIIQFQIPNSIFLDLFSGSGIIGIEAISRNAMKVISIEKSKKKCELINKNLQNLQINNMEIINDDVLKYLDNSKGKKFDFIFLDPPSGQELHSKTILKIFEKKILKPLGLIIIEKLFFEKINLPSQLIIKKTKKYGKTIIIFIGNII